MKNIIVLTTAIILLFSQAAYSEDFSQDEINGEVFDEYEMEDERGIFNLYVNGKGISRMYPIMRKNRKMYISLYDFISGINLNSFRKTNNILYIYLGIDAVERKIDLNNREVEKKGRDGSIALKTKYSDEILSQNGVLYVEREFFEKLMDSKVTVLTEKLSVNISTKFETPSDIALMLKNKLNTIEEKKEEQEITYVSERELINIGNARFTFTQDFSRSKGQKKFEKSWSGRTEYSSALLYGNFATSYDFKNGELGSLELYYENLWKEHSLTLGRTPVGKSGWENGVRFKKDKGYYTLGREVVIRERVPIGSVVELIYMGTPLEIKAAEDGYVEFFNYGIQLDRKYTLKIYAPSGEIYTKEINTAVTYNQQNKGEIEYSGELREDSGSGKYRGNIDFYYGYTQNLTLSGGLSRQPVGIYSESDRREPDGWGDDNWGDDYIGNENMEENSAKRELSHKFDDRLRAEVIYTDYLWSYPYTVGINGETALSNFEMNGKKSSDLYSVGTMGTINIKDLKLEVKNRHHGKYYDERDTWNFESRYNLFGGSSEILYKTEVKNRYSGRQENSQEYGLNLSRNFGTYSLMGQITKRDRDVNYRGDIYYNGFEKISIRAGGEYRQAFKKNIEDTYELNVSVRNKGWNDIFDFSIEGKYRSNERKNNGDATLGLSFSVKIDDWLTMDGRTDRSGNHSYSVGVDKVVSLKAPTEKISDIKSSRAKIRTFIDSNGNGSYDYGEELIPKMAVSIGDKSIKTDEDGVGYIHGLSNGIQYEVKALLEKPEYYLSYSTIKVIPRNVSEILVDIPVRPMVTLEGYISLESLGIEESEEVDVYNNILITVTDENGKELELTTPEDNGEFRVSGLFSNKYYVKIQYMGHEKEIVDQIKLVELAYGVRDRNRYVFDLKDRYSMLREGEESGKI